MGDDKPLTLLKSVDELVEAKQRIAEQDALIKELQEMVTECNGFDCCPLAIENKALREQVKEFEAERDKTISEGYGWIEGYGWMTVDTAKRLDFPNHIPHQNCGLEESLRSRTTSLEKVAEAALLNHIHAMEYGETLLPTEQNIALALQEAGYLQEQDK